MISPSSSQGLFLAGFLLICVDFWGTFGTFSWFRRIAFDEKVNVGDKITLSIKGQESTWNVVGLIINLGDNQSDSFFPLKGMSREFGAVNHGTIVMVTSEGSNLESERDLINKLEVTYTYAGIKPSMLFRANDVREQSRTVFNFITHLLYSMAFLAAVVIRFQKKFPGYRMQTGNSC